MSALGLAAVVLQVFFFIVLARVIMSWIPLITNKPLDYSNPIVKFLIDVTEPLLAPMRRYLTIGMSRPLADGAADRAQHPAEHPAAQRLAAREGRPPRPRPVS